MKLGDISVVDRAVDCIGQSGIYLIVLNGETALRRFSRSLDGALRVSRDNKETYPDVETIDGAEGIRLLGKVISKVRVDKFS